MRTKIVLTQQAPRLDQLKLNLKRLGKIGERRSWTSYKSVGHGERESDKRRMINAPTPNIPGRLCRGDTKRRADYHWGRHLHYGVRRKGSAGTDRRAHYNHKFW